MAYAFIGLFNAFIANSKPLIAQSNDHFLFPAAKDFFQDLGFDVQGIYQKQNYEWAIYPPIHFHAKDIDNSHTGFKSPSECKKGSGHYLGTDQIGRDITAGLVRGCYTSLRIGIFGTIFCCFIGVVLGIAMAYYGNDVKKNILQIFVFILSISLFLFYLIFPIADYNALLLLFIFSSGLFLFKILESYNANTILEKLKIPIPFDRMLMSIIELRRSLPTLILVLVMFPLFSKPSVNNVIFIITIFGWTNFARHARAEALSVKSRDFVTASSLMGGSFLHLAIKHILPNIAATIAVIATLNFSANILLESTLSFLGMGLPADEVSWGSMLSEGRKNFYAWWQVVFPGMAIFVLVFCVNKMGER